MNRRNLPVSLAAGLMVLAAAASPALAENAFQETFDRYNEVMSRYDKRIHDVEVEVRDKDGATGTLGYIQRNLPTAGEGMKVLENDLNALRAGKGSLDTALGHAAWQLRYCAGAITEVEMMRACWAVRVIGARQVAESLRLLEQFNTEIDALRAKETGEALEADTAAARRSYIEKEREVLRTAEVDYRRATREFLARRRDLVSDLWRLQDFNLRRDRTPAADAIEDMLYGYWEVSRGVDHTVWSLDPLFISRPPGNQLDSLDLRPTLDKSGWRTLEMDDDIRAEPVEEFRCMDTSVPDDQFPGNELEQAVRRLYARMNRCHELEVKRAQLVEELSRLNAQRGDTSFTTPDTVDLARALEAFRRESAERGADDALAQAARSRIQEKLEAVRGARNMLLAARCRVRLDSRLRPVPAGRPGGHPTPVLLEPLTRRLALYQRRIEDGGLGEEQERNLRDVAIPELQRNIAAIEAASESECRSEVNALRVAVAACDAARREAPAGSHVSSGTSAWLAVRDQYNWMVGDLPAGLRAQFPDLPAQGSEQEARAVEDRVRDMKARFDETAKQASDLRFTLRSKLSELRRVMAEASDLGRTLTDLRVTLLTRTRTALQTLGAGEDSEVMRSIASYLERIDENTRFLTGAGAPRDAADRLRAWLATPAGQVAWEAAKKVAETMSETADHLSTAVDYLQIFTNAGSDPGAQAEAIRNSLSAGATIAEFGASFMEVPMTAYFAYLGLGATAILRQAVDIQESLIQGDISRLAGREAPERHLYTEDEVAGHLNEANARRMLQMIQVRRALFLAQAQTWTDARDLR